MMTAAFQLTKEELIRYFYFSNWASPNRKKQRLVRYSALAIPGVIVLLLILFELQYDRTAGLITYLFPLGFLGIMALSLNNRMKAAFRKQVELIEKENDPEVLYGKIRIDFSAEGIQYTNAIEDNRIKWKGISRKATDEQAWYLYLNSHRALIIPFRCFPSAEEKKAFEKLLSEHLPFLAEFPDQ